MMHGERWVSWVILSGAFACALAGCDSSSRKPKVPPAPRGRTEPPVVVSPKPDGDGLGPGQPGGTGVGQPGRWEVQKSAVEDDLMDVAFVNDAHGVAVGANQTILRTTDGGRTWRRVIERKEGDSRPDLTEIVFSSPREGWAISGIAGSIWHTADGGATWQSVPLPRDNIAGKHFCTQSAVGSRYYYLYWGLSGTHLYQTDDVGKTWQELTNEIKVASARLNFLDTDRGWYTCVRGTPGQGLVGRTMDGGKSWQEQKLDTDRAMKLQFIDKDRGWVLPESGDLWATADGGKSWTKHELGLTLGTALLDLHFVDAKVGYLLHGASERNDSGYAVRQTTDGGSTWKVHGDRVSSTSLPKALVFTTTGRGWVVGTKGYIAHFRNK